MRAQLVAALGALLAGCGGEASVSTAPSASTIAAASTASARPATSPTAPPAAPPRERGCKDLCRSFAKRRAECVDDFVSKLTMAPDMLAKVKENHRKNADGNECPRLCDTLGETAAEWGRCAEKPGSCSDFRQCYEAANANPR